jgi:hypothetical protein
MGATVEPAFDYSNPNLEDWDSSSSSSSSSSSESSSILSSTERAKIAELLDVDDGRDHVEAQDDVDSVEGTDRGEPINVHDLPRQKGGSSPTDDGQDKVDRHLDESSRSSARSMSLDGLAVSQHPHPRGKRPHHAASKRGSGTSAAATPATTMNESSVDLSLMLDHMNTVNRLEHLSHRRRRHRRRRRPPKRPPPRGRPGLPPRSGRRS